MRTCYVKFESSDKEYAYDCGALDPQPGKRVVVLVGKDKKLKIVTCSSVVDGIDPIVSAKIFATLNEQPNGAPDAASL